MSTTQERMLNAFAAHELSTRVANKSADHSVVGVPLGTRLMRIIRSQQSWRLWLSTADYKHGTYLDLFHNGMIIRVVVRVDEGDEVFVVRPSDEEIRS